MGEEDPESVVRAFYAAYSDNEPERFDTLVAADYTDYGHSPPGRGPQGTKDDLAQAIDKVGAAVRYDIDALVVSGASVAVAWTGHLPHDRTARGLSLYQVRAGQITETRHAAIGAPPS